MREPAKSEFPDFRLHNPIGSGNSPTAVDRCIINRLSQQAGKPKLADYSSRWNETGADLASTISTPDDAVGCEECSQNLPNLDRLFTTGDPFSVLLERLVKMGGDLVRYGIDQRRIVVEGHLVLALDPFERLLNL